MLTLLSVNPTGFMSFGMEKTYGLSDCGLIRLLGKNLDKDPDGQASNGSGKTSFFNAITLCLFGKIETYSGDTISPSDEVINEALGKGLCIRTEWINGRSEHWRVTIARKWKGQTPYENDSGQFPFGGTDIYLEQEVEGTWIDKRKAESPKTRKAVIEAVGMSYERFRATSYLAQNRGGLDFLKGSHAQKMSIFTDAIGLSLWDQAIEIYKSNAKECETSLSGLSAKRSELIGQKKSLVILTDSEAEVIRLSISNAIQEIGKQQATQVQLQATLESLIQDLGQIQKGANPYSAERLHIGTEIQNLQNELAYGIREARLTPFWPEMQVTSEADKLAWNKFNQAKQRWEDFVSGKMSVCPTCGQALNIDGEILRQEALKLQEESDKISLRYQECEDILYRVRVAGSVKWFVHVDTNLVHLENNLWKVTQQENEWVASQQQKDEALKSKQGQLQTIRAQLVTIKDQILSLETNRAFALERLSRNDNAKYQLSKVEEELALVEKQITGVNQDLTEWQWLAKFSGDKGFKSWKVDIATEQLNGFLADALADIDPSFSVWCKTYRVRPGFENKPESELTLDEIVPEYTVYIKEGTKNAVPFYLYSGGETTLVALPFVAAFWRLTNDQGQGTNILLLDEIAGALDSRSAQLATNFIQGLKSKGKTVLLVSHNQNADVLDYDATWVVTKKSGISQLSVQ